MKIENHIMKQNSVLCKTIKHCGGEKRVYYKINLSRFNPPVSRELVNVLLE